MAECEHCEEFNAKKVGLAIAEILLVSGGLFDYKCPVKYCSVKYCPACGELLEEYNNGFSFVFR